MSNVDFTDTTTFSFLLSETFIVETNEVIINPSSRSLLGHFVENIYEIVH